MRSCRSDESLYPENSYYVAKVYIKGRKDHVTIADSVAAIFLERAYDTQKIGIMLI